MWHGAQQHLALNQCFAYKTKFQIFQIAQPAMEQLGGCRRGGSAKIPHFGQPHTDSASGRVSRNATAIDPATDYKKVKITLVALASHVMMLPWCRF